MESLLYFWTPANVIDTHLQSTRNISERSVCSQITRRLTKKGQARAKFTGKLYFKERERENYSLVFISVSLNQVVKWVSSILYQAVLLLHLLIYVVHFPFLQF